MECLSKPFFKRNLIYLNKESKVFNFSRLAGHALSKIVCAASEQNLTNFFWKIPERQQLRTTLRVQYFISVFVYIPSCQVVDPKITHMLG
jgi:hypothetical protein